MRYNVQCYSIRSFSCSYCIGLRSSNNYLFFKLMEPAWVPIHCIHYNVISTCALKEFPISVLNILIIMLSPTSISLYTCMYISLPPASFSLSFLLSPSPSLSLSSHTHVHCLQVYNEGIHDLLGSPLDGGSLELREDPKNGLIVSNLSRHQVWCVIYVHFSSSVLSFLVKADHVCVFHVDES